MLDDYTRTLRRKYLGSSDAAAIVGRDPWRSAYDVWAEKTGRLDALPALTPSAPLVVGTYLEPAILSWAEDQLQTTFTRSVFAAAGDIRCANFDALAFGLDEAAVIEAKTAGLIARPRFFDDFGAAGTDELPDHVVLQAHHQLAVAADQADWPDVRLVYVPVLLVGIGFILYRVPRNDTLTEALVEAEERFWRDHVLADTPPPDVLPSMDTIRSLIRRPDITVDVPEHLVQSWLDWRQLAKETQHSADEAQQKLLAALGDAEAATSLLGTVTYRQQTRAAYTAPASTYRVVRFKATRAPKEIA